MTTDRTEVRPRTVSRHTTNFAIAAILLVFLTVLSVKVGSVNVTWEQVWAGLGGSGEDLGQAAVAKRLSRSVLALVVGLALALSGLGMQAVTRNPLADPGIFGISQGASFAVVIGIAFLGISTAREYMLLAVTGAWVAALFVYTIGSAGRGGPAPLKVALAGAATAATISSLINITLLPRVDMLQSYQFWQIGGVGGATWPKVFAVLPPVLLAAVALALLSRKMNALALGDDVAAGLGENVRVARALIFAVAVGLAGLATAVAGPIGFVGLMVPHLARLLLGPDYRLLVPFSAIAGGVLLLASDILGRVIARPSEVQVGIITALIGAPFFIWLVRRQKVREL